MHVLLLALVVVLTDGHCPHMMGVKLEQSGPSPPATLPEGDKGWDYDEKSAPGMLPSEHYIQTTYIFRSPNEQEKSFSSRVRTVLANIKERLAKQARLTVDNENIECEKPTDHFRCEEFPQNGAFNYLIVEDAKHGARVYDFERKHNEKNDGTIEAALLDAMNRHYPLPLGPFASKEAEKEVGFIRQLSNEDFLKLSEKEKKQLNIEKFSPIELQLIDSALLETRSGEGLEDNVGELVEFKTQSEFDLALDTNKFVFVLFWNNNDMTSLHVFNLWAKTSIAVEKSEDTIFAHVKCHENSKFCDGLRSVDFRTIVAYKDGKNSGSTENLGEVEYYKTWAQLIKNGPLIELKNKEELDSARKGEVLGLKQSTVTIGVFPSQDDTSYKHFAIAAEKLAGRYFIAYFLDKNSEASVSTYRVVEKQKRTKYNGKFDPASLISFITVSSIPNLVDISGGFTTDAILRQKRAVLIHVSTKSDVDPVFLKFATREDARKDFVFAKLHVETDQHWEAVEELGLREKDNINKIVLLNQDRVFFIDLSGDVDQLNRTIKKKKDDEPDHQLSTKDSHPLRFLQRGQADRIFGRQNSLILPDHTLFLHVNPFAPRPISEMPGAGGCPFMNGGGGGGGHSEL